ncbi:MAG: hypothetical protein F4Z75_06650 [Synechococcus sp. SB0668_bin_15]|nr:hypothetical protein [Synechococcus sp. SB0668_bin_15]
MNLPQHVTRCVCSNTGSPCPICWGDNGFQENGKQVKLRARSGETVKAVVVDDCLLSSQKIKKCDDLFILKKNNKNVYIVLVELKGTHIKDAFAQLASVRQDQKYECIVECFPKTPKPIERAFVITGRMPLPPLNQQAKLEEIYGIRVKILASQKTKSKALDLREHL